MRSFHPFFVTLLLLGAVPSLAQPDFVPRVWTDFPVRIEIEDPAQIDRIDRLLAGRLSREHRPREADAFELRVDEHELELLRRAGFDPVRVEDRERAGRSAAEREWAARTGDIARRVFTFPLQTYPSYAEIGQILDDLVALRPDIARTYEWGTSVQGRALRGLVISDHPDSNEAEPEVRLAAGIHGNETVMMIMLLNLAHDLITSYEAPDSTRIDAIVEGTELHILPLFNPDGYVAGVRGNANGVDLNRNFPEPAGQQPNRQPEVLAFMQHALSKRFVVSLMGHGGALVVNYPWDWTYTRAPDDAAMIELSLEYSTRNLPMYNGFFTEGITNGADWYVANGTLQDWAYDQTDCIDVTLETSNVKWPAASTLAGFWSDNRGSLLAYVEGARGGIQGIVRDAVTGDPLDAVITVAEIDAPVGTDPTTGDFYKLLPTAAFTVQVDAQGYTPRTFFRVFNTWGVPRTLDVDLQPEPTDVASRARPVTRIESIAPNPFNPSTTIEFRLAASTHVALTVIDARGRRVRTLADGPMQEGPQRVTWTGVDDSGAAVGSGVYFVRLRAGGVTRSARVTLVP